MIKLDYAIKKDCSKSYGLKTKINKEIQKLKHVVKLLFYWGVGLALIFTIVYLPGVNLILKLLTTQAEVIKSAQPYLIWVILVPIASFGSFIWDGVYIGATASKAMRNTLLGATFLVFAPVYYLLNPVMGNHALWMGMLLFMFSRGFILSLLYKKTILKPITGKV